MSGCEVGGGGPRELSPVGGCGLAPGGEGGWVEEKRGDGGGLDASNWAQKIGRRLKDRKG